MIIDSHVQFWKYNKKSADWITNDMKVLQQDYLPAHIELTLKRNDVYGVVAVQSDQSEVETLFLTELKQTNSFIKGIVGWADFTRSNILERLEYFYQFPSIKGWRHNITQERATFMTQDNFLKGIEYLEKYNYTYDLLIDHSQIEVATQFTSKFPNQKFVLDHCANPNIESKDISRWEADLKNISHNPNVYCKLSGLLTRAIWKGWSPGEFYPYMDVVFNAFGTDRVMFGSDWPFMLLSGIYVQWKSLVEKYMENYSPDDQAKVFYLNAVNFYNLDHSISVD